MWDIIIPILTFIAGLVIGGFVVGNVLKKQMTNMYSDPTQIQNLARSMGMNLNQKQLNIMTRKMQNSGTKKNNSNKPNKPKK